MQTIQYPVHILVAVRQREIPFLPRHTRPPADFLLVQVIYRGIHIQGSVERAIVEIPPQHQIMHQGSIHPALQFLQRSEHIPHHVLLSLPYQRLLLRVPVLRPLNQYDSVLVILRGAVIFPLRGRDALRVLIAIVHPEEAQIHLRLRHFRQVSLLCRHILCRQFLEQERLEEPPHHRILPDVRRHLPTLRLKLPLYAAYE